MKNQTITTSHPLARSPWGDHSNALGILSKVLLLDIACSASAETRCCSLRRNISSTSSPTLTPCSSAECAGEVSPPGRRLGDTSGVTRWRRDGRGWGGSSSLMIRRGCSQLPASSKSARESLLVWKVSQTPLYAVCWSLVSRSWHGEPSVQPPLEVS